jgi:MFS family permease
MNKSLKVLLFSNSIFVFAGSLLGPLYAIFVSNIDNKILSVSISWFALITSAIIFTYVISLLGDRVAETEYLLIGGYIVRAVAWFLFIYVNSITSLIFLQILLGLGEALGTPSFNAIFAKHLDGGIQIKEYSQWKMLEGVVTAVGVLLGGIIVTKYGFTPLFLIMSLLALATTISVALQPRERL